jgi:NAD(P)H-hydrate epimerase
MKFILPIREQNSNKGTFGKVLNVAGSKNYIGAAYLSSLAVLKSGAGYVALTSNNNVIKSVSALLPEAVFLSEYKALKTVNQYDVLLIGCGLGQSFLSKFRFKKYIKQWRNFNKPVVIDADGLNILANTDISLPENCIITPHPGEAARLLDVQMGEVLNDSEIAAQKLTQKYNCVTVLKTHNTIVCAQNGEIYVNRHGNSALAKAGSGDILAGIIAGLLAQKMSLFEASRLGVYLHSRAGEIASQELTEYSVLASELTKYLPKAINELILQKT